LLGLGLLLLNGQWDARFQCVVNAALHATVAVIVLFFTHRFIARRWHAPLFALVALGFGLPLAWQNILGGFHSQQILLVGFSLAAVTLLIIPEIYTWSWWTGAIFAGAALLNMGSGLLAVVVVVPLYLLRAVQERKMTRSCGFALCMCVLVMAAGMALRVTAPYHEPLKAHGLADFALAAVHNLQWPLHRAPWFAAISFAPWI